MHAVGVSCSLKTAFGTRDFPIRSVSRRGHATETGPLCHADALVAVIGANVFARTVTLKKTVRIVSRTIYSIRTVFSSSFAVLYGYHSEASVAYLRRHPRSLSQTRCVRIIGVFSIAFLLGPGPRPKIFNENVS